MSCMMNNNNKKRSIVIIAVEEVGKMSFMNVVLVCPRMSLFTYEDSPLK